MKAKALSAGIGLLLASGSCIPTDVPAQSLAEETRSALRAFEIALKLIGDFDDAMATQVILEPRSGWGGRNQGAL